jgi:predicted nucleotidyltransferase
MLTIPLQFDQHQLSAFCRKWSLSDLSLFGSVLRPDFHPDSDVDVLVTFKEGHTLTLESYTDMREELSAIFGGRPIDLVETRRLADSYRRHEILRTRESIYAG